MPGKRKKSLGALEREYAAKLNQAIVLNASKTINTLQEANKQLAKRIAAFTARHPLGTYKGGFYKWNQALQRQISDLLKQLSGDLLKQIDAGILQQWGLADVKNNLLTDQYLKDIVISNQLRTSFRRVNLQALKAFQNRSVDGLNLADRVWNIAGKKTKAQLEQYLASGIITGRSAAKISKDLDNFLKGKPIKYKGKLLRGQNLTFQSIRLAATEQNMAYRMSDYSRRMQLPFVTGVRIHLSLAHPRPDICDPMAGDYPKGFVFGGWHPICICYQTSILMSKQDAISYLKTGRVPGAVKYVNKIPGSAKSYLFEHKAQFRRWKTKPYFLEDNFTAASINHPRYKNFVLRKDVSRAGVPRGASVLMPGVNIKPVTVPKKRSKS